jgi:hypothetical protein
MFGLRDRNSEPYVVVFFWVHIHAQGVREIVLSDNFFDSFSIGLINHISRISLQSSMSLSSLVLLAAIVFSINI